MNDSLVTPEEQASAIFEKKRHERLLSDVRGLVSSPGGRRAAWHVLSVCRPMHSSFNTDPLVMAFNEGRRSVGLFFMDLIMEAKPEAYDQMRREAASNAKSEEKDIQKLQSNLYEELG